MGLHMVYLAFSKDVNHLNLLTNKQPIQVCVCVELQAFCIFGLNCLLAGRSDALRAMTFTGTKLSWILLLLRGAR